VVLKRMPSPPLLTFAAHKAPHLIHLGGINLPVMPKKVA